MSGVTLAYAAMLILAEDGRRLRALEYEAAGHARPHADIAADVRTLVGPEGSDAELRQVADLVAMLGAIKRAWQAQQVADLPEGTRLRSPRRRDRRRRNRGSA